jgi:zinc transport system permease protein
LEILHYEFMRRAVLAGLMVGALCPTIGLFLVLRRLSLVGDTLAHVSLAGVLLGILWGISPLPTALLLSVLLSLFLEKLRGFFHYYGELSLAVIMAAGLGASAILLGITRASDAGITSLLFGSIITLTRQDLFLIMSLAALSCGVVAYYYRELFFVTFDEEGAGLAGINTRFFNHLLVVLAAVIVALGLRLVGALLVASLMVIPAATSLLLHKGFLATLLWAVFFGILAVAAGLVASYYLDLAPGGTIVMSSVLNFLILLLFSKV